MAVNGNGVTQPAGSDAFDPVTSMGNIVSTLRGRIEILAATAAARTALTGTCGWTPTPTDPLVVLQVDTKATWIYDGTNWTGLANTVAHARFTATATLAIGATTWTTVPLNATVDASAIPPGTLASNVVTVPQSGVYLLSASISATLSTFAVRISVGTNVVCVTAVGSGASLTSSVDRAIRVTGGQVVKVEVYATTGMTVTADAAIGPTSLTITQLGL